MSQKVPQNTGNDPEPPSLTPEKAILPSKEAVLSLFRGLDLFQKLSAYETRLKDAQMLDGELKLQVLRNILERMVRFQQEIDRDIEEKIHILEKTHDFYRQNALEDEEIDEMAGYTALFLAKMHGIQSDWEEIITEQHEENLIRLQELLDAKNDL